MSDAVMVPRAFEEWLYGLEGYGLRVERLSAEMRDPVDKILPWLLAAFDVGRLATSTPVGGWEDDPYLATDLALVNDLIYQHGGDAALAGWVRLCRRITAAPPSVSTGSRPREAILHQTEKGS